MLVDGTSLGLGVLLEPVGRAAVAPKATPKATAATAKATAKPKARPKVDVDAGQTVELGAAEIAKLLRYPGISQEYPGNDFFWGRNLKEPGNC